MQLDILSLSSPSSLDMPQFWMQAAPTGRFLEQNSESTATALAVQMLGMCSFLGHIYWKNPNPLGLHVQAKFCMAPRNDRLWLKQFLVILNRADAWALGLIHFKGELLREHACSAPSASELWPFGFSIYPWKLGKTTAWLFCSQILNTAHCLLPIIITYLCIM